MTKREKEIISILKKDPLISQNDLAKALGISRSSAAVHITNLMKKGVILGKGYVVKDEKYVAVLGGANIDINGIPKAKFILGDSNPGFVSKTLGGVGRNIAEDLAKLGVNTRLLTLVGNDSEGETIVKNTKLAGVDVSLVKREPHESTGIYITVQDENGDLIAAINQMNIYENMDTSYIGEIINVFNSAEVAVLDTNISPKAIDYLFSKTSGNRIFVDPVSVTKAARIKKYLNQIFLIKPNINEAELLSGIKFDGTFESMREIGDFFMNAGCKNLVMSMGSKGLYMRNEEHEGIVTHRDVKAVNVNGAGDALIATMIHQSFETDDVREWCVRGVAAAILSILSQKTTSDDLNEENIEKIIKEYYVTWKDI